MENGMKTEQMSYLFALIAVLLWSTVATAFKIALKGMDFMQVLMFSSFVSAIVLFIIVLIQKKIGLLKQYISKHLIRGIFLGFLNPFLYYTILLKSYSVLPAQEAMILNYTWPIMLVILSIIILKQPIKLINIIAIFVSFIGIAIIASKGDIVHMVFSDLTGDILALSSSIIWALFWILNVRDKNDEVMKLFVSFSFGFIFSFILTMLFSEIKLPESKYIFSFVYIGFFEMSITFTLWLIGLKLATTSDKVSNLVFLSPFLSLLFIHFIIGEEIKIASLFGLVMIVCSILFTKLYEKRKLKIKG
jgi:drug/metabolite transporter (DMT)-like permease